MLKFVPTLDEKIDNVTELIGEIGTFNTQKELTNHRQFINGLFFTPYSETYNNGWKVIYKNASKVDVLKKMVNDFNKENSSDLYAKIPCVVKGKATNQNYKDKDNNTVYQQGIEVSEITFIEA